VTRTIRLLAAAGAVAGAAGAFAGQGPVKAKNIFLFISDGGGFNHFNAGAMYQYGFGNLPYEGPGWTKFAATTYPLRLTTVPDGLGQDPSIVYDALQAWDPAPEAIQHGPGTPVPANFLSTGGFAGYNFLKTTFVDSASAGTQIASGEKSYNNAINWTNFPAGAGTSLDGQTTAELAKAAGRATGVVASVYFSHATPATTGGAHNINRNNLLAISSEMLDSDTLDLIMSPGHPEFNDAGLPTTYAPANANNIGGDANWQLLKSNSHPGGWTLIEQRSEFVAIADGTATPPQRLIGIAQTRNSLQYNRPFTTDWDGNGELDNPFPHPFFPVSEQARLERQSADVNPGDDSVGEPFVANVPTLVEMTVAAINTLVAKDGANGIYLMVEGAHIDWAGHGHDTVRLIEEQADFDRAVEAAIAWVEANSNWEESLVIVTADHECGMLWGPNSDTVAFDPIVDNGIGNLPGMRMNSSQHTNQFVPIYARGVGAERFADLVDGEDPMYLAMYGMQDLKGWSDEYLDITDMFTVIAEVLATATPCPADLDGDGEVGSADVGLLLSAWGTDNVAADLDGNGVVDGADLGLLTAAWGACAR
jgi:alkaline phosphatase